MSWAEVTRNIAAPVERVFAVASDIEQFSKAVPHITHVEMLSEQHTGLGARFRETRLMKGREHTTELEVIEYLVNDRVRMVSDAGGTIWDTLFTVRPKGEGAELHVAMDARPHKLLARIVTPFIRGAVQKAIESDIDAIKAYCER